MYQAEEARIERAGGTVQRVVLDFELKKKVFGELNKEKAPSDPYYSARKEEIAAQHGLKVVSGRVVFPTSASSTKRGIGRWTKSIWSWPPAITRTLKGRQNTLLD
ncbi:MAG: hypothetical protein M3Y27_06305 [Acidobacteriota bacterium]|nr:hypothetical protein [Acidobacteriota bacterium]